MSDLRGNCFGAEFNLMFPTARAEVPAAKAMCVNCPAIRECREMAINNSEGFGVWAGINFASRSEIRERLSGNEFKRWNHNAGRVRYPELA